MCDQYHIFRQLSDGAPLWVQTDSTLQEAEEYVAALAKTEEAHFGIFHAREARFVTPFPTSVPEDWAQSQ